MNDFVNDFKPHLYLINLRLLVISIFLNYASIILCYLDRTEFLFYLLSEFIKNSCSKFAKLCIACSVLRLYINGLEAVSLCFAYKYTHLLEHNELEIYNTALGYASCSIENFSFIVRPARSCICKQNTHNSL